MFPVLSVAISVSAAGGQPEPLTAYPHPLVTEILYAVPRESGNERYGDAAGDGSRDATGDEFVEVINPHDEAISLAGYTITDAHPAERNRFSFTFPDVRLEPGQAAVVFNGNNQRFDRAVGTDRKPGRPHAGFFRAFVFDAGVRSKYIGFANAGDGVLLSAPDGSPLTYVEWGDSEASPPRGCPVVEEAPKTSRGSVRLEDDGAWREHPEIEGLPYSPGVHPHP